MHVMVLGAGVTGVTTAWYLRKAGFDVSIVDRQAAAGLETSFANGGQISVSHPEPWANPSAPLTALRWLGREDAPLLFRPHAQRDQWQWALSFLFECLPWRTRRNTEAIARLAVHSAERLRELREETGIRYDQLERGILHLFFSAQTFGDAPRRAAELHHLGIAAEVVSAEECVRIEPALAASRAELVGGLYAPDDESGDAHCFTQALAARLPELGVQVHLNTTIERLSSAGGRIDGIEVRDVAGRTGTLSADAYVLCLGSHSRQLMAPLGEHLPIYPVKGYSLTAPVIDPAHAPEVSLTDESRRIVCSRLGDRLRIAGTAELDGYNTTPREERGRMLLEWAQNRFPGAIDPATATLWAGLRPATPGNVPIIGRSAYDKLWYNTGHGTLGWTLACGSAAALAELISGRRPTPDFPFR
ncbi:amino acid dehydrogenase [Azoarcus sp. DD4]|uniref:D-amino acid dehydrogenase n=1 Tax=Azoarcus sp. DD4 TaxID=2027405 RepID=UPI00112A0F6F|nr:D-amino acid dehydrogenase [Azoarcus sp. DD4]QDF96084.1 amino acid dehydrogenase [Azoarcus sp. DD4]